MPDPVLLVVFAMAIGFGIANGFNDAANAIATVISTRALSPRVAILMAALLNFAGALTGTAVAVTIGKGILTPDALRFSAVIAGLAAIIIWAIAATYLGLPVSVSHGFVAGLAGAGMAVAGSGAVVWNTLQKVMSAVVIAPALGFTGAFIVMVALSWILRGRAPDKVRGLFSKLQILGAAFMAYSHGLNDGQMPMGVMALALFIHYHWIEFYIPLWVKLLAGVAIAFGTAVGGWNVIKTTGFKITKLGPVNGFSAIASAASVVEIASLLGIPVSTTHCISSAIMGVGATRRLSAVRWGVAGNIVAAWVLTFPICGVLGFGLGRMLDLILF